MRQVTNKTFKRKDILIKIDSVKYNFIIYNS